MKLYVVRHGQTDGNVNKIMDGIRDIDLNNNGIEQAQVTRDSLKDIDFDLIICSPLIRTKHTMEIININNNSVVFDERIMERDWDKIKEFDCVDFKMSGYWE